MKFEKVPQAYPKKGRYCQDHKCWICRQFFTADKMRVLPEDVKWMGFIIRPRVCLKCLKEQNYGSKQDSKTTTEAEKEKAT